MAPNRHAKHFRPTAATTTQNGHKKMKISTLEIMRQTSLKHVAPSFPLSWRVPPQAVQTGAGGGEGSERRVPLQGGAKFHVTIALHNSGSQNREAATRPKEFSSHSCAYTALHKSRTPHTHTHTQLRTQQHVLFVSLRSGFRNIIKMGEKTAT